jgi:hypothetical protein
MGDVKDGGRAPQRDSCARVTRPADMHAMHGVLQHASCMLQRACCMLGHPFSPSSRHGIHSMAPLPLSHRVARRHRATPPQTPCRFPYPSPLGVPGRIRLRLCRSPLSPTDSLEGIASVYSPRDALSIIPYRFPYRSRPHRPHPKLPTALATPCASGHTGFVDNHRNRMRCRNRMRHAHRNRMRDCDMCIGAPERIPRVLVRRG